MSGRRFSVIEDSIKKSFLAVKKDIGSIRKSQKEEAKKIQMLLKEKDKGISKKLYDLKNSMADNERFDFLERRLDEMEENVLDLEDEFIDKKKIMSFITSLKRKISKMNIGGLIAEIRELERKVSHFKKRLESMEKSRSELALKSNVNKELYNLKTTINSLKGLKNTIDILELKFDDIEDKLVDIVSTKEFVRSRNRINASIREIKNKINI